MFALADCNNFYASCERAFNSKLNGKPLVVLSNNDGCVIARSNEAKALGIEMGAPLHLNEKMFREKGVVWRSSNYVLYGDMSARVTAVLRQFTPTLEVYSIDEQFLGLQGFPLESLEGIGREAKARVMKWTGIPISVGIAPTKTLAKIANRYAKKNPETGGVFALYSDEAQEKVLAKLDLEDIWGVSDKLAKRLRAVDIHNALDLRRADPKFIKDNFNVVLQRTCMELKGISCLSLEMIQPKRKSIVCSRAFGSMVTDIVKMREAVSTYACRAGVKLRKQGLVTNQLVVFMQTNPFNKNAPQYHPIVSVNLTVATSDSRRLVTAALKAVERMWQPEFRFKKAGIILNNLHDAENVQLNMFAPPPSITDDRLMKVLDKMNRDFGHNCVVLGSSGIKQTWSLRADFRSPRYTTQWEELFTAFAR